MQTAGGVYSIKSATGYGFTEAVNRGKQTLGTMGSIYNFLEVFFTSQNVMVLLIHKNVIYSKGTNNDRLSKSGLFHEPTNTDNYAL